MIHSQVKVSYNYNGAISYAGAGASTIVPNADPVRDYYFVADGNCICLDLSPQNVNQDDHLPFKIY